MKKHLYLMPILALSLASFALSGCDDKKDADATADTTTTTESTMPAATETAPEAAMTQAAESTIHVADAYSFATAEGATTGAVFATLQNAQTSGDMLTGASAPDVAGSAEIHENYQDPQTGVAEMRKTAGVDVAAGSEVKLEPTGYHIMLLDLKKPLVQGETFNVTLTFRNAGDVVVPVTINAAGAASTDAAPMNHDAMAPADATTAPTATTPADTAAPAESLSGDEEAAPAEATTTTPAEDTTTTAPATTTPTTPADDSTAE